MKQSMINKKTTPSQIGIPQFGVHKKSSPNLYREFLDFNNNDQDEPIVVVYQSNVSTAKGVKPNISNRDKMK